MPHGAKCGQAGRRLAAIAAVALVAATAQAQNQPQQAQPNQPDTSEATAGGASSKLLHVPVSTLFPGGVAPESAVKSPVANDPQAAQRGMEYYNSMNCVGCHAPNGAGGMGPALSIRPFIYGDEPAQIFLSILQGRPNGMPSWGAMLPHEVIWDLAAYIGNLSNAPQQGWGKTTAPRGFTIQQVPAQSIDTAEPWKHTEPFSYGQAPLGTPQGAPPAEAQPN